MDDNLRTIDDHIGLYTLLPPVAPGTPLPQAPADGDGQIFTDGSYAVFNGGNWKMYPARAGMLAAQADGTDLWFSVIQGGWLSPYQAVIGNLEGPEGASLIGFRQAGIDSVSRTVKEKLQEWVSLLDKGAVGDGITDDTAAVVAAEADGRLVDGLGFVYLINSLPHDLGKFTRAAFKFSGVIYPTDDWLPIIITKITNGRLYTAWPQDKCYVLGNQIKVGVNVQQSHLDVHGRAAFVISEDGGSYYDVPEYIDETLLMSHWAAGTDGAYEYTVLMDKSAGGITFSYMLMRRPIPFGPIGNYDDPWINMGPMTLVPPGTDVGATPAIMHSFDALPDGRIAIGTQFPNNIGFYLSADQGVSWSFVSVDPGGSIRYTEPTIKHSGNIICGFLRPQSGTVKPVFWYSADNMVSFDYIELPLEVPLSPVPLQIVNGEIHAFASNRSGNQTGGLDDRPTPIFYIRAKLADVISQGATAFEIIRLGTALHLEEDGASGVGVGSVVHYHDKIFLFFGSEERTGASLPYSNNRRVNIWQAVIPLEKNAGYMDFRNRTNSNAGSSWPGSRRTGVNPRWIMDPGEFAIRRGHVLSEAYKAVPGTAVGVIDGRTALTSQYISTDGSTAEYGAVGATGAGSIGAIRFTLTNGAVQIISAGRSVIRWDNTSGWESLVPEDDAFTSLGRATHRWSQVYAASGAISTSDSREKQQIRELTIAERNVAAACKELIRAFKFNNSVTLKGATGARIHFGVIAQNIKSAFEAEGLDPNNYALFCYDEWGEKLEVIDDDGNVIEPYHAAGSRYGIRYDELLVFIIAAM
jgi:hypothetical protein